MARKYEVTPSKTYATEANVEKAVERAFPDSPELVYIIMKTGDGRFFPIFVGKEAITRGVHFHFNVVAF